MSTEERFMRDQQKWWDYKNWKKKTEIHPYEFLNHL